MTAWGRRTNLKKQWQRSSAGLYLYHSDDATAEVFCSPKPLQRWAWAVYYVGNSRYGMAETLESAQDQANEVISLAERKK